jgi:metal-responsive CopG/Arc/MetJ family transcriptional regulator
MPKMLLKAHFCHTFAMRSPNLRIKKISITLGAQLIEEADKFAVENYTSRTSIIRIALIEYLRKNNALAQQEAARPGRDTELEKVLKAVQELEDE